MNIHIYTTFSIALSYKYHVNFGKANQSKLTNQSATHTGLILKFGLYEV